MDTSPLLPDPSALRLEQVSISGGEALILVSSAYPVGDCPVCGRPAARIHSRYVRTLQDLSWQGTQVTMRWRSRKFFCDTPGCPQRIFTERVPTVTCRYGRRTNRAREVVQCLGLTLGGEGGCRVATELHLPISADALLREVRRATLPSVAAPRVVGVDDWALRRGQRYGTLIVDLERHCPLDLLPDRKWETLRDWLGQHPSVEVLSRDRAECYAHGARIGAPAATQVADRWHVLANLRDALKQSAKRFAAGIQQAAQEVFAAEHRSDAARVSTPAQPTEQSDAEGKTARSRREMRRSRRLRRYQQVKELWAQGKSQADIARTMKLDRKTVCRYVHAAEFPGRRSGGGCTPVLDDLKRLWNTGCHNMRSLTGQLVTLGYRVSYESVRCQVASWRRALPDGMKQSSTPAQRAASAANVPSANRVAWLLFLQPQELDAHDQRLAQALQRTCPPLRIVTELAHDFTDLVKQHRADGLEDWIQRASAPDVPVDVRKFAHGLLLDRLAIAAALSLPWSNGQTEGQVNRLKLLKRAMYGRAKLDLLRQRFLAQHRRN